MFNNRFFIALMAFGSIMNHMAAAGGGLRGGDSKQRQLNGNPMSKNWRLDVENYSGAWAIKDVVYYPTDDCSGTPVDTSADNVVGYSDTAHANNSPRYAPDNAFDGDTDSIWSGRGSGTNQIWIAIEFPNDVAVNCVELNQSGWHKTNIRIQYLPNGDNQWTTHWEVNDAIAGLQRLTKQGTIALDVDTPSPTPAPTAVEVSTPPPTSDDFVEYAVIFSGHDEVLSINAGSLDISWSPAFVYAIHEDESKDNFVDMGDYTYHIIVAKGNITFYPDQSISDLANLAQSNAGYGYHTTIERNLYVTGLDPTELYSVLVVASTSHGQESYNRSPAVMPISSVDPIVNVPEVKILPESDGSFQVTYYDETDTSVNVEISGNFPADFSNVQVNDFLYVVGNGQVEQDVKLVQVNSISNSGILEFDCTIKSLYEDVFDELDLNAVLADSKDDEDDDLLDGDELSDDEIYAKMSELSEKVKVDFCIMAYDLEDSSCFDENFDESAHGGRKLTEQERKLLFKRIGRGLKKAYKSVKRTAKKVAKVAKKVVDAVKKISVTLDTTITFLDIEKTAAMTCETEGEIGAIEYEAAFEIGIVFDLSAKARFKIRVSVAKGMDNAMAKLFGGFGTKAYMELGATAQAEFAPDPITLFKKSKTKVFTVGPVPIVITNRPKLEAYIEANAAVEAEAVASAQIGWDYDLTFNYDKTESPKFWIDKSFEQRDVIEDDPEFSLRVSASVELGMVFSWDIVLYGVVQASLAAELGATAELEVSSTLESIIGTDPYFYILDAFNVGAHIRVSASLGLNNPAQDVGKALVRKSTSGGRTCEFAVTGNGFSVPGIDNNISSDGMPPALETIKDWALNPDRTEAWTDLAIELVPDEIKDTFGEAAGEVLDVVGQFLEDATVEFEIFEKTIDIFALPEIGVEMDGDANICEGDYAVSVTLKATEEESEALVENKVQDWMWFGNFDGTILSEDSNWEISSGSRTSSTITVGLKRSGSPFEIGDSMGMYLRATPEQMSWPAKSLFASFDIAEALEGTDLSFQCCDDSDCGSGYKCDNGQCEVSLPKPECSDANPSGDALEANFSSGSEARHYCYYEHCFSQRQYCGLWETNFP